MPNIELTKVSDEIDRVPAPGKRGFALIRRFSLPAQREIARFQEQVCTNLREELRTAIYRFPSNVAHTTIETLINPRIKELEHERIFEENADIYDRVFREIADLIEADEVTFNAVEVSANAITIIAEDSPTNTMRRIRDKMRADLKKALPADVFNARIVYAREHLIHSSPMRFQGKIPLEAVRDAVAKSSVHFKERIADMDLVRGDRILVSQLTTMKHYIFRK
ncbi:MAG: hypothetical protein HY817_03095 [Candidatus Abawacabacteria bacterium]|nr:hypothetical protein [Candidatus Abawacabacteria bacterium]